MTTLQQVVAALEEAGQLVARPARWPELTGITDDSRRVQPGNLFCAVVGSAQDGHQFLDDAVRRGAAAALIAHSRSVPIPVVVVRESRVAAAIAASAWYGWPAAGLRCIGVTGTNGKSTTVTVLRHLLNGADDVGAIGTLGAYDGSGAAAGPDLGLTTPGAVDLQGVLAALRARRVTTVVMEASSHALDQLRLHGLRFAAGVYTNLTHDHLDYHKDLQSYLAAKMLLSAQLVEGGIEVVNADDPSWSVLKRDPRLRRLSYGVHQAADVQARDVRLGAEGTSLELSFGQRNVAVRLPLLGEFNVSNAAGAAGAAWGLGMDPAEIAQRLASAPQVLGRMERIASDGFVVLRDYAHTPDALERAIQALRPLTTGRLVVLFGCGGDRDRRKRPVMGRIAAHGADLAIVTSDNPRTEDPDRIIDEIEVGMEGVAHLRIADRREAVTRAVHLLRSGDCLLLAGKGHEIYQVVGEQRLPLDERQIVEEALSQRVRA